jgi:hypothetical protein
MKKLQPYLLAAIIYILGIFFIFDGHIFNISKIEKLIIFIGLILSQLITFGISFFVDIHNKIHK